MDMGGPKAVSAKKTTLTPKAIIHQKFGSNASYKVEEVQESTPNACPGLAIPQKGPCLYRCHLQLPEISVVSDTFKRKKDAEQSAAEKAIEKLGIHPTIHPPTAGEAWDELVARLSYLFSIEFLSCVHPLSGHFRAALQREGPFNGFIPVSVISIYDAKVINLCKHINSETQSNPLSVMSLLMKAAARSPASLSTSEEQLSIRRLDPYPPEIVQSLVSQKLESTSIGVIRVPYSDEKTISPLTLNVAVTGYYLDVIAQELGVTDASKILVSRPIGKASSEMRMYFCVPMSYMLDVSSELHSNEPVQVEGSLNTRASYFSGQDIYGDAILASIGYTWKSTDLFHEDVHLSTYYRLLINKIPGGIYKLSRDAIIASELPVAFTTRSNWRGSYPRDILCTFCRQHRLSEPDFSAVTTPFKSLPELPSSCKKLKVTETAKDKSNGGEGKTFRCEVKIFSKCQDLIIECSPKESFKKQIDATQNAALKILSWLNLYFKKVDMSLEMLCSCGDDYDIQFYPQHFFKEFVMCTSVHNCRKSIGTQANRLLEDKVYSNNIEGQDSGVSPSSGSLVCIKYRVSLVTEEEYMKELLESSEEFEFEIGNGGVIPHLEAIVAQMSVGQAACFNTGLPPQEFILAATDNVASTLSMSSSSCSLEYTVTLLRVTEPLEDRMEQALFSPPLSKQRVEYALQHIKKSSATSLVDFGCGSGSLLDSLLQYPTSLEKITGVDISQRSLARAAKTLHSKLSTTSDTVVPTNGIKSALLYEGSITIFDSRLYGYDIGTCLEVIEHMEEDQACLFGDVVLSSFCPRILIVSTPNYEYNIILQKSTLQSPDEDSDEKNHMQSCKFRNHDHKFEWTREQFNRWASDLSQRHKYSVEFSGVGGVADVEPGFASQIAVFRRGDDCLKKVDPAHHYEVIWEWSGSNMSTPAL